jgi:hypothetical protein
MAPTLVSRKETQVDVSHDPRPSPLKTRVEEATPAVAYANLGYRKWDTTPCSVIFIETAMTA